MSDSQLCFVYSGGRLLLLQTGDGGCNLPLLSALPEEGIQRKLPFTWIDGREAVAVELSEKVLSAVSAPYILYGLREAYDKLSLGDYRMAGKAEELLDWDARTRFCGHCGTPLQLKSPISKYCPHCQRESWPKLSPAIIVRITRGDEILLVQSLSFKHDYYGLVAGFVELGETLEECVRREVMEETSLHIRNLRYFASQAWPYPRNLMAGFTAEYESGELHLQHEELRKGGWFTRNHMPAIPAKLSIARMLIDDWLSLPSRHDTRSLSLPQTGQ